SVDRTGRPRDGGPRESDLHDGDRYHRAPGARGSVSQGADRAPPARDRPRRSAVRGLRCSIPPPMSATILIVEDEFAVARGIQYALQQEGYQVAVARSGEDGLDLAVNQAPDLVVLDVRLPGIDGFEVLRRLRAAG